jgi:chromosome segregation ATPase
MPETQTRTAADVEAEISAINDIERDCLKWGRDFDRETSYRRERLYDELKTLRTREELAARAQAEPGRLKQFLTEMRYANASAPDLQRQVDELTQRLTTLENRLSAASASNPKAGTK